jgi:hypothetical protein
MYLQSAIVVDETKLPEFIHENIDATARRPHLSYMLKRNVRIEADLVDQLFNSTEKRLARAE